MTLEDILLYGSSLEQLDFFTGRLMEERMEDFFGESEDGFGGFKDVLEVFV